MLIPRFCGLRADDVASLSWNSVDLANGQLDYVAKKNGQRVRVPMDKQLAQLLMEYRTIAKSETYLFPGRTRSTLDDGCVREAVRKTAARAGIGREVTPHDLRKTFATDKYYREEATLLDL